MLNVAAAERDTIVCCLDVDGDGSITPKDFEILADKLSSLIGQGDVQRREDYANARKTLCHEIMRADANQDGKVTLGKSGGVKESIALSLVRSRGVARLPQGSRR